MEDLGSSTSEPKQVLYAEAAVTPPGEGLLRDTGAVAATVFASDPRRRAYARPVLRNGLLILALGAAVVVVLIQVTG